MQRDIDEAEILLLKWAESMRHPGDDGMGYPAKASGGFSHSWIKDFEEQVESADATEIGKINAAIDSLKVSHREVIYMRHKLGRPLVWRWANELQLYSDAKAAFSVFYFSKSK